MGTHPIFESDFDCLTEMAKKGSTKKKGGGGKGKKEKTNPREAFIEARLEFRQSQLKTALRELQLQEDEVSFSLARVNDSDEYRSTTINGILAKLHQVDAQLTGAQLDNESELARRRGAVHACETRRATELDEVRAELNGVLERNGKMEDDIRHWSHYNNQQAQHDARRIAQLESLLAEHNAQTYSVVDFIKRQIANGQAQYDARERAKREEMRHEAFDEAFRCTSPSDFYECRESERLTAYVDEHSRLLATEAECYQRTSIKAKRLENERDALKGAHLERPQQCRAVLDGTYFA